MSKLDELYTAVTAAIAREEEFVRQGAQREAMGVNVEIARLEAEIAELTAASTVAGEAARLGAVIASEDAGDLVGALQLAERYSSEPGLAERPRRELEHRALRLRDQLAMLRRDPMVRPVDAKLAA